MLAAFSPFCMELLLHTGSLSLFVSFSDVILFSGRIRVHSTIPHHWGFQASKNNLIQICYAKKEDKIEQLEIDF
jgi:hypothetical protein